MLLEKVSFWLLILTICVVMSITKAGGRERLRECKSFDVIPIDDDTVIELSKKIWYFPLMMEIPIDVFFDFALSFHDMTSEKKLCAYVEAKTEFGRMVLSAAASYVTANRFKAIITGRQFVDIGHIRRIHLFGALSLVLADKDYDYLLLEGCINENMQYWFVVSPHKTLRANQEKKIKEKVKSMGTATQSIVSEMKPLRPRLPKPKNSLTIQEATTIVSPADESHPSPDSVQNLSVPGPFLQTTVALTSSSIIESSPEIIKDNDSVNSVTSQNTSRTYTRLEQTSGRIPADTPTRGSTSSEDDSSLRSIESQDKEKSTMGDEYLAITMPSTPSTSRKASEDVINQSFQESKAKSSFIRKWTKKVAKSFVRTSLDKNSENDLEVGVPENTESSSRVSQIEITESIGIVTNDEQIPKKPIVIKRPKPKVPTHSEKMTPEFPMKEPEVTTNIVTPAIKNKRSRYRKSRKGSEVEVIKLGDKILGVHIHRSDLLPNDPDIRHPVVRLTVMDQDGNWIQRSIVQNGTTKRRYIEPVLTQPCHMYLASFRQPLPEWEEILIIDEHLYKFFNPDAKMILFFEIMDFLPINHPRLRNKTEVDLGWHRIAWAFLKPVGGDGTVYINRKLRLQLYLAPTQRKHGLHVFDWWQRKKFTKLNSSLHVTLKELTLESNELLHQPATTTRNGKELRRQVRLGKDLTSMSQIQNEDKPRSKPQWSRLSGQTCKVPNKIMAELPLPSDLQEFRMAGSVVCVKFSPCGIFLAAGMDTPKNHLTLIFEIPSGKLMKSLRGHHGLIYDIDWKVYDRTSDETHPVSYILASASADSTALVWKLRLTDDLMEMRANLLYILLHTSYVYALEFYPSSFQLATACFDSIIRIWDIPIDGLETEDQEEKFQPIESSSPFQILDIHKTHVNAIRFHPTGNHMVSGDGAGILCKWSVDNQLPACPIKLERELRISSASSVGITSICIGKQGRKVLVQLQNSSLKILDFQTLLVLHTFKGHRNVGFRLQSTLSPCGNLVLSGSEDGTLHIWDSDTGRNLSILPAKMKNSVISTVSYHPFDHFVAVGYLVSLPNRQQNFQSTVIYAYENINPKSISLKTLVSATQAFNRLKPNINESKWPVIGDILKFGSQEPDVPVLDGDDFERTHEDRHVHVSKKFQSILQKLDEVTAGISNAGLAKVTLHVLDERKASSGESGKKSNETERKENDE